MRAEAEAANETERYVADRLKEENGKLEATMTRYEIGLTKIEAGRRNMISQIKRSYEEVLETLGEHWGVKEEEGLGMMMDKGSKYVKKLETEIIELKRGIKVDKKGEGNEGEGEGGNGAEGAERNDMKAPEKKEGSTEQGKDGVEEGRKEGENEGEGKGEDKYSNYIKIHGALDADRGRGGQRARGTWVRGRGNTNWGHQQGGNMENQNQEVGGRGYGGRGNWVNRGREGNWNGGRYRGRGEYRGRGYYRGQGGWGESSEGTGMEQGGYGRGGNVGANIGLTGMEQGGYGRGGNMGANIGLMFQESGGRGRDYGYGEQPDYWEEKRLRGSGWGRGQNYREEGNVGNQGNRQQEQEGDPTEGNMNRGQKMIWDKLQQIEGIIKN